ncbi:carbohydrate-binding family 9-like protein [Labilibaculum euxinus]
MRTTLLIVLMLTVIALGKAQDQARSYMCYKTSNPINIDGVLSDSEWGDVDWSEYFVDIEGDKKPLPTYKTHVKMAWDEDYFYVAAELEEPHVWAKLKQRDTVIFYDNDFEVFIDPQGDNHRYYEFEMNALNTIWDLMLAKPYRDGAPAINAWDIKGLKSATAIYGTINDSSDKDEKWTLEIAFPWEVLKECAPEQRKPKNGEQWRVNFSRVNWDVKADKETYLKCIDPETGKTFPEHNWVWSPQGVIAMHQPETWGYVQFSTTKAGEGSVVFKMDEDYPLKRELIKLYKQQKQYCSEKGSYQKELKSPFAIQVEVTKKQFIIYAKGKTGKTWYIDHESKIWSE